jgi:hypothetical protein
MSVKYYTCWIREKSLDENMLNLISLPITTIGLCIVENECGIVISSPDAFIGNQSFAKVIKCIT